MADIVDLTSYKSKATEKRIFGPWEERFGISFAYDTRISDISDKNLLHLSQPGEESTLAFYELIMGVMDLGTANNFYSLENKVQRSVMEIHLFLSDLFRFEMMHRLGWIEPTEPALKTLVDLVVHFKKYNDLLKQHPPQLSTTHPDYSAYQHLHERDREGFIRRLLPGALDIFQRKLDP